MVEVSPRQRERSCGIGGSAGSRLRQSGARLASRRRPFISNWRRTGASVRHKKDAPEGALVIELAEGDSAASLYNSKGCRDYPYQGTTWGTAPPPLGSLNSPSTPPCIGTFTRPGACVRSGFRRTMDGEKRPPLFERPPRSKGGRMRTHTTHESQPKKNSDVKFLETRHA